MPLNLRESALEDNVHFVKSLCSFQTLGTLIEAVKPSSHNDSTQGMKKLNPPSSTFFKRIPHHP